MIDNPEQYCINCGKPRGATEYACSGCGCDLFDTSIDGNCDPQEEKPAYLRGLLSDLHLPGGMVLLLSGVPGSGKSTIAMQALSPPRKRGVSEVAPVYVTTEMRPDLVQSYARRQRLQLFRVCVPTVADDGEVSFDGHSRPIIYDSLNERADPELAFAAVKRYATQHNVPAIAIAQTTKKGEIRGSRKVEHAAEIVAICEADGSGYRIRVIKNRIGPCYSRTYTLSENGVSMPIFDRYYSIEGAGPDYKIEPYPSGGRYAEPLRRKAPGLPPPPCAVAAEFSDLYGGWIQPSDVKNRAEYSKKAGIPFWSVTDG